VKTFLTVFLTAIIVAIMAIGGTYYFLNQKCARENTVLETQIKASAAKTATADSAETLRKAALESSKTMVSGFLSARQKRNFDFAKPYMTVALQGQYTQDSFAGASSPSMGRFEIIKAEYLTAADLYQVTARVYQNLNGQEIGYTDNIYNLVKEGNQNLINEIKEGVLVAK